MKKLIIINGTMGVGKSTVCNILLGTLKPSVYLDGDWCWNMNPFVVSEENKKMVINNITHLLKAYLDNSGYEYIIFCWVIHEEYIFRQLLESVKGCDFELYKISLVCSEIALKSRLEIDVQNGIRKADVIDRSLQRLDLYNNMDTIKIDVSDIDPKQTAIEIIKLIGKGEIK
ncbi:AAA family ATPase [Clostridium tagluense]|uniref:AAA family ATPase n=1 Tax=Clostridium tagluense TaxID=360422 RepID=UPI001C0E0938|nr:AAA family ATPase [Clostridium tagluense]MBU3127864.1 AAA family ATPase [Clostridium tagluense]MBW9159260.1 AAA family ATPase [Clostridium tagluense]WLC66771.1 AAA family ATPase [Clostridium tagluense]